jgi:hypothetical protein
MEVPPALPLCVRCGGLTSLVNTVDASRKRPQVLIIECDSCGHRHVRTDWGRTAEAVGHLRFTTGRPQAISMRVRELTSAYGPAPGA